MIHCEKCRLKPKPPSFIDSRGAYWQQIGRCRMTNTCMDLDAVETGHPFIEVISPECSYGTIIDTRDRGEQYIREHLREGYRELAKYEERWTIR